MCCLMCRFDIETFFRKHTLQDEKTFKKAREDEEQILGSAIAEFSEYQ